MLVGISLVKNRKTPLQAICVLLYLNNHVRVSVCFKPSACRAALSNVGIRWLPRTIFVTFGNITVSCVIGQVFIDGKVDSV